MTATAVATVPSSVPCIQRERGDDRARAGRVGALRLRGGGNEQGGNGSKTR